MAAAVTELYPETQLGIGPVIDNGFYYDFLFKDPISESDLLLIEKKMKEIQRRNDEFIKESWTKKEANAFFKKQKQSFKLDLIKEIPEKEVGIYRTGGFTDLCKGPHIKKSSEIGVFKLLSLAGAYWRGSEQNQMLTRIYGTAWKTKQELDEHLNYLKEVEARDHRKLGKDLDLFSFNPEVGAGLALWHSKGAFVRKIIEDFWKEKHLEQGYQLVNTPHIASLDLWKTSGHWDFYRENMYAPFKIENQEYVAKPMNCPLHIKIFQTHQASYRDLPVRIGELGTVYRYERSGVLHGLLRVRGFTQDDAHIFCRSDQYEKEIERILGLTVEMLKSFGFNDYQIFLSTRPEKYIGTDAIWKKATNGLEDALKGYGLKYEEDKGGGTFYGPKIDLKIKDALGRFWQCSTIQLDFNLPERFDIYYIDEKGKKQRPIMIHRAVFGSLERFVGILIEHYAGIFPVWLAPIQARILPVGEDFTEYAHTILEKLKIYPTRQ